MKAKAYTTREFNKLKRFEIDDDITHLESDLFLAKIKDNFKYKEYIIKKLKILNATSLANKMWTVIMLGDYGKNMEVEELVIPEHQIFIDGNLSGFSVPRIKGRNLGKIIKDFKTPNEDILKYFFKVGVAIEKVQHNSAFVFPGGVKFHFGDLHAYNIIIDENDNAKFVDLDSGYVGSSLPNPSMYLSTTNFLLNNQRKYPVINSGYICLNIPNDDTDLYCYNMMILEFLANYKIRKTNIEDYYGYLGYLQSLGYGPDILESFFRLPISCHNINPCNYLDQIPKDKICRSSYSVYQYLKNKKVG